jgi:hypothetical protein
MLQIPRAEWEAEFAELPAGMEKRLRFMSANHHLVRYFVVRELPRAGAPMEPDQISDALELGREEVVSILDDLESHLFFLVRNERGAVSWAYPGTVDRTPHHMAFSTGERLYAA